MNRRQLLKSLIPIASLPVLVANKEIGRAFEIKQDKKYLVLVDATQPHDVIEGLVTSNLPAGTTIHPVLFDHEDEPVRIYEVG